MQSSRLLTFFSCCAVAAVPGSRVVRSWKKAKANGGTEYGVHTGSALCYVVPTAHEVMNLDPPHAFIKDREAH